MMSAADSDENRNSGRVTSESGAGLAEGNR